MCSLWEEIVNMLPLEENFECAPSGRKLGMCSLWEQIMNVFSLVAKYKCVLSGRKL